MADDSEIPVHFEDLALIEDEFEEVDNEIMRQQYNLSKALYARRAAVVAQIPHFWALVMEQAPVEVDQFIHPHDSQIFAESLVRLDVTRPELDSGAAGGSPRSLHIKFEFQPNDFFEDTTLEKTLWYRRAADGWTGLVSEPVKVHWKKGKDLTEGLTDGAVALWEARKAVGDMRAQGLPEYTALQKKVESWNAINTSFFTWFGWVSDRRWVSADESATATAAHQLRKEARKRGEKEEKTSDDKEEDDVEVDDIDEDDSAVEVHEAGDELAISLADDIWPNAIKWFTQASEIEDLSDVDFEDDDDMDDDEDDEDEGGAVDIRALVAEGAGGARGKRQSDVGPPSKKAKK